MGHEGKLIKQKGIEISWELQKTKQTEHSDGFCSPREWQIEAFNDLKDVPHMILNAPMGSGKSLMMCFLSAHKMKNNPFLRCIIAVPQTIIASGFINEKLLLPDGERLIWSPSHNLCDKEDTTSTIKYVIQWLETTQISFNDRILICTHTTLVEVYKQLLQKNRVDLFNRLLLWVDEAHHVKNSIVNGSNNIGSLVSALLSKVDDEVQVGLTTATFFRGDRDRLITQDMEKLFKRFNLPYDAYLKTMKHLKSFSFDFLICGQDYMKAIEVITKQRKGKDIIYIPKPRSRHSQGCKHKEVRDIIKIYQNQHGNQFLESEDNLTILKNGDSAFKILDLVTETRRKEKKDFLADKTLQNNRDHLDAIIALDMFKEGANWIWADRSIIVGSRGSLVDVIQMIGRLFRDAQGKEHVEVIQLLPFSLNQQADDFKDNLNNYLKAVYSLLILEDILKPIKILIPKKDPSEKETKKTENFAPSKRLYDLIPDENNRKAVIDTATKYLINISSNSENKEKSIPEIYDAFQKGLPSVLEDKNQNNPLVAKAVGEHIWSTYLRDTFKVHGIDVEHIDFDIVQNTHPLDGLLRFTSNTCDINTFQQLRDAIQASFPNLTKDLLIALINQFIDAHGRKPSKWDEVVTFAKDDFEGITWNAINATLVRGNQTLPGGSSLADFIETEFGIKNPKSNPTISPDTIYELIQNFITLHGRKPQATDGAIDYTEEGLTWEILDRRLRDGNSGLESGSSLTKFIETHFGIRDQVKIPEIPINLIHFWIQKYLSEHKKKPTAKSGKVEFAQDQYKNISWHSVNTAMKSGKCGLKEKISLATFIEKEFSIRNPKAAKPFTEDLASYWIQQFIKKHKRKPTVNDGVIEFAEGHFKDLTWRLLNNHLHKGSRGFSSKSSLRKLVALCDTKTKDVYEEMDSR
jgi:superfamily II DNA or RNA helicase